jgi:hypothetical protein
MKRREREIREREEGDIEMKGKKREGEEDYT